MSFRLFIYYCALCGGGGGFLGWALGRMLVTSGGGVFSSGLIGMWLGLGIAMALSALDGVWNLGLHRVAGIGARIGTAVMVGAMGGFLGGIVAQLMLDLWNPLLVVGWTFTGLLIGVSLGIFDLLSVTVQGQEVQGAMKKIRNGLIGGTFGGLIGGILYLLFRNTWLGMFDDKPEDRLWSPSATGFFALGACIGLLIALAQVILKEAWVKVEQGFRRGREQIISKQEITIGRAEGCDIGLFGDPAVDKLHAKIRKEGPRYVLVDDNSTTGTYVNDERVIGSRILRSGDLIRLGNCLLRYGERAKQE